MYISLHNHSDGSLLDGYQTVQEMVARAKSLGMSAISLTDHDTMRNTIRFYEECQKNDIKPIVGCEFYFCPDVNIRDKSLTHHLVILAMNDEGYMNLKKLDTFAYNEDSYYYKPRIDWEALREHNDGLICLSACMASIVNTENGEEWFKKYKELFGDRFYAEIQPLNIKKQWEYNDKVIGLARKYNVPLVVTTDAHYSIPEDKKYHQYWIQIKNPEGYHNDENYVWSEDEIRNTKWIPHDVIKECIENTQAVADRCNVSIETDGNHFPRFPTDDAARDVRNICRSNWRELVPKGKYKEYAKRFEEEMATLEKMDYLNYMLIVHDFLGFCYKNDIPVGVGRGSVSGSLVGYLMKLHRIDPIVHHTEFFRFANPFRITNPDIDTDLSTRHRGEIIQYIKDKYGMVAKIMTLGYTKNPQKDEVGKEAILKAWQSLFNKYKDNAPMVPCEEQGGLMIDPSWEFNPKFKIAAMQFVESSIDDLRDADISLNDEQKTELIDVAKHFCGRLSKKGVHASGILVTPDAIENYAPIEGCSSTDKSTGKREYIRAVGYEYHTCEAMGLMKLDCLGLNTTDIIDDTLKLIRKTHNIDITIDSIPLDDEETYKTYANGDLCGVFQMESNGMQKIAKALKVSKFDDIAILVSTFRPGPIQSGMVDQIIEGKNGGKVEYPCEAVKEVTESTYGVFIYQEQIMKISMKMAGYNLGQADVLRKAIGRKEITKIDAAVKQFTDACLKNGYSMDVIEPVATQIKNAGSYVFNRSHAISYSLLSYITAYLKTHYPCEFLVSTINSKDNQEKTLPYIAEARRLGIRILPPSLIEGNREWEMVGNNAIRVGLTYIKGVGKKLVTEKCNAFNDREMLTTWKDIVAYNSSDVVKSLISAGALDFLKKSRGWMMGNLLETQKFTKRMAQCDERFNFYRNQYDHATNDKEKARAIRMANQWNDKINATILHEKPEVPFDNAAGEMKVLGFSFTSLPDILTGIASSVHEITTKNGNKMALVTFKTDYGDFKGSIAPFLWGQGKTRYGRSKLFVVQGKTYDFMLKKNGQYTDIVDVKEVC